MSEKSKQPTGYREQVQLMSPEQLKEGELYMNNLLPQGSVVKIVKKNANSVKFRVWNDYKGKFIDVVSDYDGFYRVVQIPVYEQGV